MMTYKKREITSESYEEEAIKKAQDVNGAIEYAQKYAVLMKQVSDEKLTVFYSIKAIGWLYAAARFCPNNRDLSEFINIDDFFNSFSKLYCFFPFIEKLVPALIRNKSIVEIDLTKDFYDKTLFFNFPNENFVTYIKQTKSLKILNLSESPYLHSLTYYEIHKLGEALGENASIDELHLEGQPLLDNGLTILLEKLSNNTRIKISKLNILNTGITNAGALVLLNFLRKNSSIGSLDLISTDKTANEYELVVAKENLKLIKGKFNLARGYYPNWVEISFISCTGDVNRVIFDEKFDNLIGISPENIHMLSNEQLKAALPKVMHEFRGCVEKIKNSISPEFINLIKNALRTNNKEAQRAYSKGAMFGLFKKMGIPSELGSKTSEYLSIIEGKNVALTTKIAAKSAMEEESKVYLGKL